MKQLLYSARARQDLREILDKIAQDKPRAAVSFVDRLEEHARILETFPESGAVVQELVEGLRVPWKWGSGPGSCEKSHDTEPVIQAFQPGHWTFRQTHQFSASLACECREDERVSSCVQTRSRDRDYDYE